MLFGIFQSGCVEDNFAKEEAFKTAVDTLFARRIKQFNIRLDSTCSAQRDSLVLSKIDSIKNRRLKAIENYTKGKGVDEWMNE